MFKFSEVARINPAVLEQSKSQSLPKFRHPSSAKPRLMQILQVLDSEPGLTRRELANRTGGGVNNLDRSVKLGHIRKRKQDGRIRFYPANYRFSDDEKPEVLATPPVTLIAPKQPAAALEDGDLFQLPPVTKAQSIQKAQPLTSQQIETLAREYIWENSDEISSMTTEIAVMKRFVEYVKQQGDSND